MKIIYVSKQRVDFVTVKVTRTPKHSGFNPLVCSGKCVFQLV
jgi:hypothetical protein